MHTSESGEKSPFMYKHLDKVFDAIPTTRGVLDTLYVTCSIDTVYNGVENILCIQPFSCD